MNNQKTTGLFIYLLVGCYFGILLIKSEAASWYRIQEMFRFQDIHMFGVIGSAILTGIISVALLKKYGKTREGMPIKIPQKEQSTPRYLIGGGLFGIGWGLLGTCPGPIFVLFGAGIWPMLIVFIFAILGTYLYGLFKDSLPH